MRASDHRRHIPIGVKLHSALLLLGFTDEQIELIEWDHEPALGLRSIDPDTGEMTPAPNDPRYIRPMLPVEHAVKTRGAGATTAGSDIGKISKLRRVERKAAEFRALLLAKAGRAKPPKPAKAKRAWPSRPFNSRKKK